jgi:hypothetical protein
MTRQNDLWQCLECGEQFVTKNMWHSCGTFALEPLFARYQPHVRDLFDHFVVMVQSIGPVTIIPQKTRISFQVRVRFVSIYPRKSHLRIGFWFPERHNHPRFIKIEQYGKRAYGHDLRLSSLDELDNQLLDWLRLAYAVGEQQHLRR